MVTERLVPAPPRHTPVKAGHSSGLSSLLPFLQHSPLGAAFLFLSLPGPAPLGTQPDAVAQVCYSAG